MKLLINCIYGTSIENIRKRIGVKLINISKDYLRCVSKPEFYEIYEIDSEDLYEQCYKDRELFDFRGYSIDSKYYDSTNKKILGKMKDEFNWVKKLNLLD